jgi:hypothetical protein
MRFKWFKFKSLADRIKKDKKVFNFLMLERRDRLKYSERIIEALKFFLVGLLILFSKVVLLFRHSKALINLHHHIFYKILLFLNVRNHYLASTNLGEFVWFSF